MSVRTTLLFVLALTLFVSVQACDRTITQVVENDDARLNCFSCHNDQSTFLVAAEEQWMNSIHASGLNLDRAGSASCAGCHGSEGFVQRVNGDDPTGNSNPTVIHCFTCHAPHTNGNFALRWSAVARLENGTTYDLKSGNTCAACHHSRQNVDEYVGTTGSESVNFSSTHWGPHQSTQADILIGSNGYEYDGFNYISSPHREVTQNGCVDCHKNGGTSNNVVGGHSFNMRWTLVNPDEGGTEEILNTAACESCHGELPDFNRNGRQEQIEGLLSDLEELLETAGLIDSGHTIKGVTTSADSAGAVWNYLMIEEDRSLGVHNATYAWSLLTSSINFMEGTLSSPNDARRAFALEE